MNPSKQNLRKKIDHRDVERYCMAWLPPGCEVFATEVVLSGGAAIPCEETGGWFLWIEKRTGCIEL